MIKKTVLLVIFSVLFVLHGPIQVAHNLEIFSEDGLEFTLIVNGKKYNESPQSNVKIIDLESDYVQVKIIFEKSGIPDIMKKNLQIANPGTGAKYPVSTVYKIIEKKGKYKLRFVSRTEKTFIY